MDLVAVIGATGTIGGRIVDRLTAGGVPVRAVAREPGSPRDGVEPHAADLTDPDAATTALKGATAVYLTPPLGGQDPLRTERSVCDNVIDAAVAHDVDHVVMHAAVHSDRGDTGAGLLDNLTSVQERLAQSGLGYTILRPAWFLQNLWAARDHLEQGVFSMPWPGDMVWAATDVDDVAQAAVHFLDQGPANRGFDVHVPGGVTGEQVADAAARVLGRDVTYQQADVTSRQYVDGFPITEPHKDLYAELFDYFQETTYLGEPDEITDALDRFETHDVEHVLRNEVFANR